MRCPKCGREMTTAELILVGTAFKCQACLGCNHLFVRINTAHKVEPEGSRPGMGAPAAECCPLTPEEEAAARKLLET